MLEEKDFKKIGEVIDKRLDKRLVKTEGKIRKELDQRAQKTESKIRKELDQRAQKTESKIRKELDQRAQKTEGKIRKEFGEVIEQNIAPVLDNMDKRLGKVEKGLKKVRATMVTKDYFDDKLADLRGDIIILLRKEDRRVEYLIEKLREKNILDDKDIKKLESAQIFARQ